MPCHFLATSTPALYRCQRCGQTVSSPHPPERIHSRCEMADEANAALPSLARRGWNLAQALAAFVADGLRTVDAGQYAERLHICQSCEQRQDDVCGRCGCRLSLKARGRAFDCPLGKWPSA
ncbi:MAG: DUF6171 family protein [Pirellulales bacterium]